MNCQKNAYEAFFDVFHSNQTNYKGVFCKKKNKF